MRRCLVLALSIALLSLGVREARALEVSIASAEFYDGGDVILPGTNNFLIVRGRNVSLPGATVTGSSLDFNIAYSPPVPGLGLDAPCLPPDCALLVVNVAPGAVVGARRFTIRAPAPDAPMATGTFMVRTRALTE
jgi:hypothetical protein